MADLKVIDVIHSGSQESMTSSAMETTLNERAMFSVRHLLDVRDQNDVMCHLPQQQHVDDTETSDPAEGQSRSHDDPSMLIATPAIARLVAGGELSLSTGAVSPPPRHGTYDMPDLVQDSEIMAGCYDHGNPCTRWLPSNTSLDCYTGAVLLPVL